MNTTRKFPKIPANMINKYIIPNVILKGDLLWQRPVNTDAFSMFFLEPLGSCVSLRGFSFARKCQSFVCCIHLLQLYRGDCCVSLPECAHLFKVITAGREIFKMSASGFLHISNEEVVYVKAFSFHLCLKHKKHLSGIRAAVGGQGSDSNAQ